MDSYFTSLKESVRLLWDCQPAVESEAEYSTEIHAINAESNEGSNSTPNPTDPNFKPTLKQVFDSKTSTISAYLTVYKTAMHCSTDELKREHILVSTLPAKRWWSLN